MQLEQNIFIIGNSRSGTSMTARILGNNSKIFTFNELHFFEELWNPESKLIDINDSDAIQLLLKLFSIQFDGYFHYFINKKYKPEAESILNELKSDNKNLNAINLFTGFVSFITLQSDKTIACEQTPRNAYFVNDIRKFIPGSKFIYLVRDPRDVLKSQKYRWKRSKLKAGRKHPFMAMIRQKVNYHPIIISKLWNHSAKVFYQNKNQNDFLIVKYEDLLVNSEEEVKRICAFVGVVYDKNMLQIPKIGSSLKPDSLNDKGIEQTKIQGWKTGGLNKAELRICENITKEGLQLYKYETSNSKYRITELFYYLIFPFQLFLILLFNVSKTKSFFKTIEKRFLP